MSYNEVVLRRLTATLRKPWDSPVTTSRWMATYYLVGSSMSLFIGALFLRGGFYDLGRLNASSVDTPLVKIAATIWIIASVFGIYSSVAAFIRASNHE